MYGGWQALSNVDGKTVREETSGDLRTLPSRVGWVAMLIYLLLGTLLIFAPDDQVVIADARVSTILQRTRGISSHRTPVQASYQADRAIDLQAELFEAFDPIAVRLPYKEGALISLFHELGQVDIVEHERGGVIIHGSLPGRLLAQFSSWKLTNTKTEEGAELEDE